MLGGPLHLVFSRYIEESSVALIDYKGKDTAKNGTLVEKKDCAFSDLKDSIEDTSTQCEGIFKRIKQL